MKQLCIAGNIGRAGEVRYLQGGSGSVCNFSVAVNDPRNKEAPPTWFQVSIWGKRGEALSQYLTKGTRVTVAGELSTREHDGKTYLEINADQVTIQGGGERNADPHRAQEPQGYGTGGRPSRDWGDDIPFRMEWRI